MLAKEAITIDLESAEFSVTSWWLLTYARSRQSTPLRAGRAPRASVRSRIPARRSPANRPREFRSIVGARRDARHECVLRTARSTAVVRRPRRSCAALVHLADRG